MDDHITTVYVRNRLRHGILSYFYHRQNDLLNWRKTENNALEIKLTIKEQEWLGMAKIDTDYKQQN